MRTHEVLYPTCSFRTQGWSFHVLCWLFVPKYIFNFWTCLMSLYPLHWPFISNQTVYNHFLYVAHQFETKILAFNLEKFDRLVLKCFVYFSWPIVLKSWSFCTLASRNWSHVFKCQCVNSDLVTYKPTSTDEYYWNVLFHRQIYQLIWNICTITPN